MKLLTRMKDLVDKEGVKVPSHKCVSTFNALQHLVVLSDARASHDKIRREALSKLEDMYAAMTIDEVDVAMAEIKKHANIDLGY